MDQKYNQQISDGFTLNKYNVDEENINDEFERIVKMKEKQREMKKGLKDKYKDKNEGEVKTKSIRSKSQIPKFKNKSKSESNSFQLISPQTNLLSAWNILKP